MYVPKRHSVFVDLDDSHGHGLDRADHEDSRRDKESSAFLRRDSNVPRVEEAAREYTYKAMKLIISENGAMIDRDTVAHVARVQQQRTYGLLSLPFSILFFLFFALSAFQHEDISNVFVVESGLRNALGKGAASITTIEETWAWLNSTIFPAIFTQRDWQGNELADKTEWNRVLSYNYLRGPLFLEQERSTKELCQDASGMASDMLCYSQTTVDVNPFGRNVNFSITPPRDGEYAAGNVTAKERADFYQSPFKAIGTDGSRRLREVRSGFAGYLPSRDMSDSPRTEGVFRALFYGNARYEHIQERLNYLFQNGWLDKQTKYVTMRALLLNAEVGRPRLQSYKLVISFSRSGEVFTKLTMDTLFIERWDGPASVGADVLFLLMLLGGTITEIRSICTEKRKGKLLAHTKRGWFVLQWAIIILGWAICIGYQYTATLMSTVTKDLDLVSASVDRDIPPEHNTLGEDFVGNAAWLSFINAWLRIFIAQYHLVLMIRFFVAFRAQPRLGVVVNTIEVCLLDIIHFMVILIPTYAAYAISGCFIFGRRLEEFSDFSSAMGICFKILMETEYDWAALSEEHYWTTALWTWSFMLFLAMLMLNMVLAIVLEAYSEQRKVAGKSESILQTLEGLFVIAADWKNWVSNEQLLKKLETMPMMFSREDFLREFPGMPDTQMERLIDAAQLTATQLHAGPEHMKHTMRMALAMKVAIDKVSDDIEELDAGSYMPPPDDESLKHPHQSWLSELSKELASQNHCMLMLQWRLQQLNWAWQALNSAHGKGTIFNIAAAAGDARASDQIL